MNDINRWENQLSQAVSDPHELLKLLNLDMKLLPAARSAATLFPLKVPHAFLARMEKGNPHDPLLKQILPLEAEHLEVEGYSSDPLQEAAANPLPGLLHKYHGRVLFTLVGTCAVNCRYCFRRDFPYAENNPGSNGWEKAFEYIAQDESIDEVILSGGDPLVVNDRMLKNFSDRLSQIPHLKRLRIHSRLPIVLPDRISDSFLDWISTLKLKPILVVHCNHPNEIDQSVIEVMHRLSAVGVTLLNQAVLLKGVNDNADTQVALCEKLFEAGILPYYLHLLDKVKGSQHFDVDRKRAKELHDEMTKRLSGFLVPKLAFEQAGAPSKLQLTT